MVFHGERLTGSDLFARFYASLHIDSSIKERATCEYLQITAQTLRRYVSGRATPPAPLVALLWHESDFGRAVLDEHAHRGMLYARAESQALSAQVDQLRAQIAALEKELQQTKDAASTRRPGLISANSGVYRVA